jgi:ATP-dependent Lon protease
LERAIAAICRKCASAIAKGEIKSMYVKPENLLDLLGAPKYKNISSEKKDEIGLVNGLAWTESGGDVLSVEAQVMPGTGKVELTGNLGDVMKESCKTAISYIRSRADKLGIDPKFYKELDLHVHFPEGAIPKDGPSAGLAICTALISALTKRPVKHDIAMTGEISLRGKALAIGGLKEKTMAALRYGVKTIIIPKANESDLEEIDQTVRSKLSFVFIEHMDELVPLAFADNAGFKE